MGKDKEVGMGNEGRTNGIVDIYPGKPGLDMKNGKYKVLGTVTLQQVFKCKHSGRNISPAAGYHVEEVETGKRLMVEKSQGVKLCGEFGMTNAYIRQSIREKKDKSGEIIQTKSAIYLQPFPSKREAFTQDDRIVIAFKMDEEGRLLRPYELNLKEEECTPEFWRIILEAQKKGSKLPKKSRRGTEDHHKKMMDNLRDALNRRGSIRNPFEDK